MAPTTPRTRYARSGDLSIAYQVVGDGPIDLVHAPGFISHLEYGWQEPRYERYLRRLAGFSRLILFDKRGTGMSDRTAGIAPLVERMDDVRAVMDAAGSQRAVVFGFSESAPLAMLFAATYPERTSALVLYAAYAAEVRAPDYPWGPTAEELATLLDDLARTAHETWGALGVPGGVDDLLETIAPSAARDEMFRSWFAGFQRLAVSPGAMVSLHRMNATIDVRALLPTIRVPTLVLHRTGPGQEGVAEPGRYVAARIPEARLVELPGVDYLPWVGDVDAIVDEIEEFVTGIRPDRQPVSVLATVLVSEIDDGAQREVVTGDRRRADVHGRFEALVAREIRDRRGRIASLSDGHVRATFDSPLRAIETAEAIRHHAGSLRLAIRTGLHTGECEIGDGRLTGTAAAFAESVVGFAAPGEVLVSSTVKDLVGGAGLRFGDRGNRTLAGEASDRRLFAVLAVEPGDPMSVDPRSSPPPPSFLTPREREVFSLVARGMTNRQISETLNIGERTAESHVASILAKCGLANRAQIAAGAVPGRGSTDL
ncbi:MAG: alpha/beta fold hydrolase [Chloroflexi bacterium]|nr:alpha/beta fold hydrolase [Chloroflexota bacterium]